VAEERRRQGAAVVVAGELKHLHHRQGKRELRHQEIRKRGLDNDSRQRMAGRWRFGPIPVTAAALRYPKPVKWGRQRVGKAASCSVAMEEVQKRKAVRKGTDILS
jgi:hypothetical protein